MTNWRDGSVNFEQHGVEFPDFWSVNAANIVTTKYFRGAVGTPQREWSLKQLIDRVVGPTARPARSTATSPPRQDAEIFEHELKHALLHQVFSFNSPVWFNVGTKSPQQVSRPASPTMRWSARRPGWCRSVRWSTTTRSARRSTTQRRDADRRHQVERRKERAAQHTKRGLHPGRDGRPPGVAETPATALG